MTHNPSQKPPAWTGMSAREDEGNPSLTKLGRGVRDAVATRSVRERGCEPILAFAILLLGLSSAAPEPDYSRYFTDYPHAADGGAASSLIEIESSTGRADRLTVAALAARRSRSKR